MPTGNLKSNLDQLIYDNKDMIKGEKINNLRNKYQEALGKYMIAYRNYKRSEEEGSNVSLQARYQKEYGIEEANMKTISKNFKKAIKKTDYLIKNLRKIIEKNEETYQGKKKLKGENLNIKKKLDYNLMNNQKQIDNLKFYQNKKDLDPVFGFGFFTIRKKLYSNLLIVLNLFFYLLILYYIYKILILKKN
jgi:hypothetical protein